VLECFSMNLVVLLFVNKQSENVTICALQ